MTTTDRELLEAAAKAAELTIGDYLPGMGIMRYEGTSGNCSKRRWNPLTDDGDALRLAVKLGIGVDHASMRSWAWRSWGTPTVLAQEEFHTHGKDAATRRAIVRAAAALAAQKS